MALQAEEIVLDFTSTSGETSPHASYESALQPEPSGVNLSSFGLRTDAVGDSVRRRVTRLDALSLGFAGVTALATSFSATRTPSDSADYELSESSVSALAALLEEDQDLVDWDAFLTPPPPRSRGIARVHLKYAGRRRPRAFDDPWE